MGNISGKNAWTVKIGEKGQFVIPKEARDMFDIHPGDTILVLGDSERGIAIPPKDMMNKYISMIFGEMSIQKEGEDNE
ncbi:MAG: AbrB/MazE/SpoVT family DNA-binding domain-containing protein [Lachnospiraceae bacterium]|nr:AbrB/MazE/SpoVT family DNA-binding domain-containing protein [Lachnospiraceae bacterium]